MVFEDLNFVIRLKVGPKFIHQDGQWVSLVISRGETQVRNLVFYMGKVPVNLIRTWLEGFNRPLWVMVNLNTEDGLQIYF